MTDQRLEKALEFANYRATLANQKAKLKDRCEAQLNYAYNGGIFHISESLISFVLFMLIYLILSFTIIKKI